ncbi:hypothetical protein J2Y66_003460 [Paenarthrobacter nitroguajacolicus]|uniref:hypothetical protein n=1 Tax=Paenarthrobacter nitroguajacolicus TaxID=211146 RepID=UPI002863D744|nr:hypothetical protein [Paenarthrobacter nitroguajacolicus]MDR6988952.1 hypothetical protein [Paenarthrobacter nitroguajacolicus]
MAAAFKGAFAVDFGAFHASYAKTARRIASREHRGSFLFDVDDMEQWIWERAIFNWKRYCQADSK